MYCVLEFMKAVCELPHAICERHKRYDEQNIVIKEPKLAKAT